MICLFVMSVISHFGFEVRIFVLIVPFPGHCLSFTLSYLVLTSKDRFSHEGAQIRLDSIYDSHFRVVITMTVSAFWHGIHPGYYLSFLTVPPILVAEDFMIASFRVESSTQRAIFDWGCWFFKMRGFDYMCMGFLLLTLDATIAYWKSIYFSGHIFVLGFIFIGLAFKPRKTKNVH